MDKYFYCYSYQLMKFLNFNDIKYIKQKRHNNGNRYWVYESNDLLNNKLSDWNLYKKIFPKGGIL